MSALAYTKFKPLQEEVIRLKAENSNLRASLERAEGALKDISNPPESLGTTLYDLILLGDCIRKARAYFAEKDAAGKGEGKGD